GPAAVAAAMSLAESKTKSLRPIGLSKVPPRSSQLSSLTYRTSFIGTPYDRSIISPQGNGVKKRRSSPDGGAGLGVEEAKRAGRHGDVRWLVLLHGRGQPETPD